MSVATAIEGPKAVLLTGRWEGDNGGICALLGNAVPCVS